MTDMNFDGSRKTGLDVLKVMRERAAETPVYLSSSETGGSDFSEFDRILDKASNYAAEDLFRDLNSLLHARDLTKK